MLGYVDGRCAVPSADGSHDKIAAFGEPLGGVAEFYERKETTISWVERNAMVHDHERERPVTDRSHQIGEHGKRQG